MVTNKVQGLIATCSNIRPLDGRILIAPDKLKMVRQKEPALKVKEGTEKKGKDGVSQAVFEKDYPKVPTKYQVATVVGVPVDEAVLKVGMRIVYVNGTVNEYDLVKGVSVVQRYNVVAILNE